MHQQVEEGALPGKTEKEVLIGKKYRALQAYRAAVRWACFALEYKRRFEREEDFGADDLRAPIEFLKDDSRREVRSISTNIKVLRRKIDDIDKKLMDLTTKENVK